MTLPAIIDIPHFKLGETSDGKLVCTTVIRASNCGVIPSTLDEWQAQIILASGEVIEMPTVWKEKFRLWGLGKFPSDGSPELEITGDQFIYERVANTPIQPGYKVSGYLLGISDFNGRPNPDFFDGATFIVDAFDSAHNKHVAKIILDGERFTSEAIYVPGLHST